MHTLASSYFLRLSLARTGQEGLGALPSGQGPGLGAVLCLPKRTPPPAAAPVPPPRGGQDPLEERVGIVPL